MNCQTPLIEYYFGILGERERSPLEEHICICADCMKNFVILKRDIEINQKSAEGPSERARLKLRAAVQAEFGVSPLKKMRKLMSRPVPAYQVAAAILLVTFLGLGRLVFHDGAGHTPTPRESDFGSGGQASSVSIDPTQVTAENVNYL